MMMMLFLDSAACAINNNRWATRQRQHQLTAATLVRGISIFVCLSFLMPVTLAAKYECFKKGDHDLLYDAVREYYNSDNATSSAAAQKYGYPIGNWCVNDLDDFSDIFRGLESFNENLTNWNTHSATTMSRMFYDAQAFNKKLNHFDVSSVFDFTQMFFEAYSFNQDISNWNMQSAEYLSDMFSGYWRASNFRKDLCAWGTYLRNKTKIPVANMFYRTDCWDWSSPDLDASPPGPFCYPCKYRTPSPTTSKPTTSKPTTPAPIGKCDPVSACVAKVEQTCQNCSDLVTSTCFTNAVKGCCNGDKKPTQAYQEKVRTKYMQMHDCNASRPCDPPPKHPIQTCVHQVRRASCPPCNVNTQCFQNVVADCCRGNEPEDSFVDKVKSKYQIAKECNLKDMCSLNANECVSVVHAICKCTPPLDFGCMRSMVNYICCQDVIKPNDAYVNAVREGYKNLTCPTTRVQHYCMNPPPKPVRACADKVYQFCETTACNRNAISMCLKNTVANECCWNGNNQERFVQKVHGKYEDNYCNIARI